MTIILLVYCPDNYYIDYTIWTLANIILIISDIN